MAQHERTNRERSEEPEVESRHKKRTHQPLYDQLKATDEGVVHGIDFQVEPSADRHAALLANAHSDKQRAHLVIQLQQSYGNAYVQRLLSSKAMQAKLTVNPPDDQYEREADRVADVVAQTSVSEVQRQPEEEEEEEPLQAKAISQIQRQLEEEEEEEIQTKAVGSQSLTVSEHLEAQVDEARGSGQPLDEQIRASLESQLGHDFSQVRIHTDAKADTLSRQLDAEAFTTGHHVFFKEGAYQPDSERGKGLIAHELTHVVQQEAAPALQRQATEAPEAERKPKESDVAYYIKYVAEDTETFYQEGTKITKTASIKSTATHEWDGNTMTDEMSYGLYANGDSEEYQRITWKRPDGSQIQEQHVVSYNKAQNKTTINDDIFAGAASQTTVNEHPGAPKREDWTVPPLKSK